MNNKKLNGFAGTPRFEVRRRLGAGGMGVVYEAFDRERKSTVALKTILDLDASTLYRFKNEFRALTDVSHPNLVRLYELFSEGDDWFFTMELVEGVELLRYVCPETDVPDDESTHSHTQLPIEGTGESTANETGPGSTLPASPSAETDDDDIESTIAHPSLPPTATDVNEPRRAGTSTTDAFLSAGSDSATRTFRGLRPSPIPKRAPGLWHEARLRRCLRQLAGALESLHHMGKLHRDIKPSNVLVTPKGRVVLLDFGLSTEIEKQGDPQTTGGHIVGTVVYMAPEQASGKPLSPASDWYAVGVMLYRALTGRLPFSGKSLEVLMLKQVEDPDPPRSIDPGIPEDLNSLCVDLLRRDPDERPTGAEVVRRLGSASVEAVIAPPVPSTSSRPFVGREAHLASLAEALDKTRQGKTVTVFVHGRSGVGKSSLIQRFLDGIQEQKEIVLLAGRCYEQESVAYKAMDILIDSLSRFLRRQSRGEVEALLPRDVQALARVFPVLKRIEAVAEAPQRGEIPDPQELRRRAFAALRELLARIGDRKLLVLYIDDLQWGDLDSAALLTELLRPPDSPILLLLCSYRSEYATISPCLRALLAPEDGLPADQERSSIKVEALTGDEARDLVVSLIGRDDEAARDVARMIVKESGGSPYFIYELVQYLQQGGDLLSNPSQTSVSLDGVLWRRIRQLPEIPRRLLEAMSVAGQPLRQALVLQAVGMGAEGYEGMSLLRSGHLIRGTGAGALDEVETYHDRIRETVVKHLEPEDLQEHHLGLARALEGYGARRPRDAGDPLRGRRRAGKGRRPVRDRRRGVGRGPRLRPLGQALSKGHGIAPPGRRRGPRPPHPPGRRAGPRRPERRGRAQPIRKPPKARRRKTCSTSSNAPPTSSSAAATSTKACPPTATCSGASACPCLPRQGGRSGSCS